MRILAVLALATILAGCASPKPIDVVLGEACARCKRPIGNAQIAAQQVALNGFGTKFRTVHCMATWIAQQKKPVAGRYWVADYKRGRWIAAERATYVRVVVNPNSMERDFIAFADPAAAAEAARTNQSAAVGWADVLELGRTAPIGGN
jgi:nitrous oxide reductase accessory protein NosL